MNKSIITVYAVILLFILILKAGVDRYHHDKPNRSVNPASGTNVISPLQNATDGDTQALVSSESEVVMKTLCLSCHAASPTHEQQKKGLAPPMWGVRDHYLEHHGDLEAFTHAIAAWVPHPEGEKSLMRGAVKRFGVMPGLSLPESQLSEIATLIYHGVNVEKPIWWEEHQRNHHSHEDHERPG